MAFNPYFTNNNPYVPYFQQEPPRQTMTSPAMVWVANEREAAGYPVAPNGAVALWDANSPCVYLKQTDAAGRPSFKTYDLVERTAAPTAPATSNEEYVTRSEFNALAARIEAITAKSEKEEAE